MTLGEIRLFAFGKAPDGWLLCDGRTLDVKSNQALFSVIGKVYPGGDGVKSFCIPDMRGVTPIHRNIDKKDTKKDLPVGTTGGTHAVALASGQIPAHSHVFRATTAVATTANPTLNFLATNATMGTTPAKHKIYTEGNQNLVTLASSTLAQAGGGVAHSNIQPSLGVNFCIAVKGDYPLRGED